ncbi:MAG: alpha/beta fold hydrolase [Verrucomicrobia bacterium]|nr:alpha/beta fold hydrolase [Verrucomicrobiota bacterium]MBI3867768.1 alpha/beta fold hydrolase [Verrucomicrobiota bacterium]
MFGEIKNRQGERLDYTFHPGRPGIRNLVVLGHGVTGNKDRPFLVALAEGLSAAGHPVLRFSYSGNGGSGGRFVDSNISKEVQDLGGVLDAVDGWKVCYAGHSMGGAVGVLRASQDPRIRWLISLAGMVHTADFARREFGSVIPDQGNMWDDPACPLSSAYMKDLGSIGSLADRGGAIRVPWLLVHGTEDDVVPIQDSRDILAKASKATTQFVEMPGSNHVFANEHTAKLVEIVKTWLTSQWP